MGVFERSIGDLATKPVITAPVGTKTSEVLRLFSEKGFRRLPLEDGGFVERVVTSTFLNAAALRLYEKQTVGRLDDAAAEFYRGGVERYGVYDFPILPPGTPLSEALGAMERSPIGAVLVGTPESIEGILTERDVVRIAEETGIKGTVGPVMTTKVFTVEPRSTVLEVARSMVNHGFRRMPVTGEEGLVGIVTEVDLVRGLASWEGRSLGEFYGRSVEEIMTKKLQTVYEDARLEYALEVMRKEGIGSLPVVDADGRLIGIITERDLLHAIVRQQA